MDSKLYLAKKSGDNDWDIYVERCPNIQHQLDGIRFLYRALKKKKHGVILNDPSGYGKRVQMVLFLSAILPTQDKPVLILCGEGMEQRWMHHFLEWTQVSDDVTVEHSNPLTKKKVFISTINGAVTFARREWSVLVVDGELVSQVLKTSLQAELRVWIISSNMKENLTKFSTFYSWVHPEEKFLAESYKSNRSDLGDVLTKAAKLDAFMENTVLRRNFGETPFPHTQVSIPTTTTLATNSNAESRITKKNKDATGTNIKRSKPKFANTDDTKDIQIKVARSKNTERNTEEFETGIPSEEKRRKEDKHTRNTKDNEINILETLNTIDHKDNDSQLDLSGRQSIVLRWDSDTYSDNGDKGTKRLDLTYKSNELIVELPTKGNDEIIDAKDVENKTPVEILHKNYIVNEIMDKIDPVVNNSNCSEDLFSTDFTTNLSKISVKDKKIVTETNQNTEDKLPANPNDVIVKEMVNVNNQSTDSIKQDVLNVKPTENANLSSFDLKLKLLEEQSFKKFKGSFLDSIF